MRQAIELPLSKNNLSISRINMSIKEKKLGGRPKLASYQKRTKCFRVMFTENDYIYIQSKAEQAGLSVNEFCHQAAMDCQVCQRISPGGACGAAMNDDIFHGSGGCHHRAVLLSEESTFVRDLFLTDYHRESFLNHG